MIVLRSEEEISQIREAGRIVAAALAALRKRALAGVRTDELDSIARREIIKRDGLPAFKGYKGFPANICVSINEAVVHGIPSSRRLKDGDIVSLDVGVKLGGYFADAAITVGVGKISEEAESLIRVTEEALLKGIEKARAGNRLGDVSHAVQEYAESKGYSVVKAFVGHGIGSNIHEEPEIPNYGAPNRGRKLEPGMVLAIEPMINAGAFEVEVLDDGWTAITKDRKLSAHFEHTIAIKESGPEIMTVI